MKLGILSAAWGRPAITQLVLGYYSGLPDAVRVVAVSPGGGTPEAEGWITVEAPNSPLSDKWNAGMLRMKDESPDAVLITGSDDLISETLIRDAVKLMDERTAVVLFDTLHCYDVASGRCFRAHPSRMGVGRLYSAALLGRMGWQPWPSGHERRLDGASDARIRRARFKGRTLREKVLRDGPGRVVVDLKTAANMWSFSHIAGTMATVPVDGPALLRQHFPDQARRLSALLQ